MNGLPSRKWVIGNTSLMSQLSWISGLELMRPSHSTTIVEKRSLERSLKKDPWKKDPCPILDSIERLV